MADELCAEDLKQLVEDATALVQTQRATHLVLDLSEVAFLNSCCLSILIQLKMRLNALPCTMSVCGCRPNIVDLFRATRLDEYLGLDHDGDASATQVA